MNSSFTMKLYFICLLGFLYHFVFLSITCFTCCVISFAFVYIYAYVLMYVYVYVYFQFHFLMICALKQINLAQTKFVLQLKISNGNKYNVFFTKNFYLSKL